VERRAAWPIRSFPIEDQPPDDISAQTTPQQRLAMMWSLAVEAWRVSGRAIPNYDRAQIAARLFGPGEPRPDDDEPR
jgi:hypothetical protein